MEPGKIHRKAEKGCLCRGIGSLARWGMHRGVTGNENNVTPASPDHPGKDSFRTPPGTPEVDFEHFIPLALGLAEKQTVMGNTRTTDEKIDGMALKPGDNGDRVRHVQLRPPRSIDVPTPLTKDRGHGGSQSSRTTGDDHTFHDS